MIIAWFEFIVAVICEDPETRCSACGRVTFFSYRTGFCGVHYPGLHHLDWDSDGDEIRPWSYE